MDVKPTAKKPGLFLNRELSWLAFNERVLSEALNKDNPLLERLKFYCITSSNLDEFFEVRVAGVKQQVESGSTDRTMDGLTPIETLRTIRQRVQDMVATQTSCWRKELAPELAKKGIRFLTFAQLTKT